MAARDHDDSSSWPAWAWARTPPQIRPGVRHRHRLNTAFVVVELIFGVIGNSVALIADAGHNMSDVLGLASTALLTGVPAARSALARAGGSG
jgi:cobalt-zinc-cadmium efflux system protein